MCKKVLTCLFICKLKNRFIFTDIYLLIFTIHYLLSFDANDILNIWPTIFFFKMCNVRLCKLGHGFGFQLIFILLDLDLKVLGLRIWITIIRFYWIWT